MNITDVGHLVSDADDGEDKMLIAARREKKRSEELADHYTKIFFDHCALLNIRRPEIVCKATDHVEQMIALIKRLEAAGIAYQAAGNVYFDVSRFPEYGELAKLDLSALQSGARVEVDSNKRNAMDFALWFTKSKFENQELQWDSPWGRGYPGWHIECSAMAMNYLGEEFDIHCGGIDHIPVHHTNEIAQSQGATGKCPARIWMHGNFLVISDKDGSAAKKMSKSTGGFLTLDLLPQNEIDPLAYRLFCLSSSYRSELAFSMAAVEAAAQTLKRIRNTVSELTAEGSPSESLSESAMVFQKDFWDAVYDDLAMPRALAAFHGVLNSNLPAGERLNLLLSFDTILGLGLGSIEKETVPEEIESLAQARLQARKTKNWAESDRLRDQIAALGWVVEDVLTGYKIKKR